MDSGIVKIHGKEYKTVALRVSEFREQHPDWSIITELVSSDDFVVIKATIADESGRTIGTGHAEERRGSTQINRTSALENCETSAIGRALSACGYGGSEYASANELMNAIHQQGNHDKEDRQLVAILESAAKGGHDSFVAAWKKIDKARRQNIDEATINRIKTIVNKAEESKWHI